MRWLGAGLATAGLLAGFLAGCPPDRLDPSPPLSDEGHTGADNPLLRDDSGSCTTRLERAATHVQRALETAIEGCEADDDCTTFVPATDCYGACEEPVARTGVHALEQAVADAQERWCTGFELDCPGQRRVPEECVEGPIRCVDRACRRVTP